MLLYGAPALFALFVWWFSTGVIMFLDGLPRPTFKWSLVGATAVLAAALLGLHATADDTSLTGAYIAFTCGLLVWGWQVLTFYMGYVTGPRTTACPPGARGWRRFGYAVETTIWHELVILGTAIAVVWLTAGRGNQVGAWTFAVLWGMHLSAKLNVFLGVRNLNEEFFPDHLRYLRSYLRQRSMNALFPVSIVVSCAVLLRLLQAATAVDVTEFEAAGFTFLATMTALAILEHGLMVLPIPAAALWAWSLKSRQPSGPAATAATELPNDTARTMPEAA